MNASRCLGIAMWGMTMLPACGRQPEQGSLTATSMLEPTGAIVTRPIDPAAFDAASAERASRMGGEPLEAAVHEIASTFCDHEQTCDNVGANRSYATRQECIARQEGSRSQALRSTICSSRLARSRVALCLDLLRGTPCVLADDGASRVTECRAGVLCSGG